MLLIKEAARPNKVSQSLSRICVVSQNHCHCLAVVQTLELVRETLARGKQSIHEGGKNQQDRLGVPFMKNKSGAVAECRQRNREDPAFEVANFTYSGAPEGD